MPRVPDTRASLILRLPTRADAQAWQEFVSLYEPFVHRFARRSGLQDADARELVQDVLLSVVQAVGRWEVDPERARFRTWLFRIARNRLLDVLSRRDRHAIRAGESALIDHSQPDGLVAEAALAHRRELFRWAATRVKSHFRDETWQAFWRTSVEGESIADTARLLRMTEGAVYIARSRVIARLRDELRVLEDDHAL